MQATFIGDPLDDSRTCTVFGVTFAKDEAVDVSALSALQQNKLFGNPTFLTDGEPGALPPVPINPDSVDIPEDWETKHWKTQAGIAQAISGTAPADGTAAAEIIKAELARRTAAEAPAT